MNALKLVREVDRQINNGELSYEEGVELLNPLFDVEPVRHGRWIRVDDKDYWMCSCCKEENAYAYALNDDSLILQDRYCPHCGAKMDGE